MKSILENIKNAVDSIKWSSQTKKEKALNLCICIYNLYVYDGGDFYVYKRLSSKYFDKIILTKDYVKEIKDNLLNNNILEKGTSYDTKRGLGKPWRFNQELIKGNYVTLCYPKSIKEGNDTLCYPKTVGQELKVSSKVNNNLINLSNKLTKSNSLHICYPKMETYIKQGLDKIEFTEDINNYIENFYLNREDILVNDEIYNDYVDIIFDLESFKYKKDNALKLAKEQGLDLIQYKDNCYLDDVERFLIRKTNDIRLIMRKSIFEIENKIFRVSRNETNRRLDYNLTNMKSSLFDYMLFEGEELVELDIANAQFTILCFLTDELDSNFIELSKSGQLYKYVADKLNITEKEAKNKMFRVAFDRVESYQDDIRELFPETMKFIDGYKNELGYKAFSNLCQNSESLLMIDGLLNLLIEKEYNVFTIHDAIRVKKSQFEEIREVILDYFNSINFECLLRIKNKKETEIINYKGFKSVEIDKITNDDKKLFISKINQLKDNGIEPSESIMIDLNIFQLEKTWYMYSRWRKSNPIIE